MNKKVAFQDLGLIDYKKCLDYQEEHFAEILAVKSANRRGNKTESTKNHLILCEHPHVYTLGKSYYLRENTVLFGSTFNKNVFPCSFIGISQLPGTNSKY